MYLATIFKHSHTSQSDVLFSRHNTNVINNEVALKDPCSHVVKNFFEAKYI
jgi:hypothetical protein